MRILIINYEYPPIGGGGGFVTRDIIEYIAAIGHDITVITSGFGNLSNKEIINGVEVIRVPVFFRKAMEVANVPSMLCYLPTGILRAILYKRMSSFDIINTHFAIPSGPVGFVLSKLFRIPNVLSIHGGDIFDPSKPSSPHKTPVISHLVKFMLDSADQVVAQSDDTRKNAVKYYSTKRKIDIIPLGIKKPSYIKKERIHFGFDEDEILFITIGRLVTRKNIISALLALSELSERFKFRFLVIGDGPEKEMLKHTAAKIGLEKRVVFFGNVSDEVKFQLLEISDCYLSTALHEGFGLVFLEAMECGLPIVCYNRGGQNDFLSNGETGFLVELGDMDAFKERLLDIVNNPTLRETIGVNNRKIVRKNYYISACAEKYIALFEKGIAQEFR